MARAYHEDLRIRGIELVRSGMPKQKVADLLQVAVTTVYRWYNAWFDERRTSALSGYQRGHSHKIVDKEAFSAFIDANPNKTQEELGAMWANPCSGPTIHKALREIDYTYKKKSINTKSRMLPK
jgi:transposase